jgi:hypothetical protein
MRTSLLLLVSVVACSSGGSTTTTDAGSPDQACGALATARCAKRMACEPAILFEDYSDPATCQNREKEVCLNSISAPGTGNTPATISACAAAFPSWSCTDWWNGITPDVCKVAAGSKANGATCIFASQCSSGYCAVFRGATCGSCAPVPIVGTPCGAGNGCGGNGLYCDTITNTCQVLVTSAGAFCDAGSCGYQLGCVVPLDGTPPSCQPLGSVPDAGCDVNQHTAPACSRASGFACVRRHCVQDAFVSSGGACGTDLDAGTFTRCISGSTCHTADAGSTCVAPAAEGFGCDSNASINCLAPARCVSNDGQPTDGGPVVGKCEMPSGVACQ